MASAAGGAPAAASAKVETTGDHAHEYEGHINLMRQNDAICKQNNELQDLSSQASRDGAALHAELKAAKHAGQDLTDLNVRKAEIL